MPKEHHYALQLRWTGNKGRGTTGYRDYDRTHEIVVEGKPLLKGSADPAFLGDPSLHNPEDLLVASLSACHMLWYLHLCAEAGIVVTDYQDDASGTMVQQAGKAQFTSVLLKPKVVIKAGSDAEKAAQLHERANELCFIARSVNFPVGHEPAIVEEGE
ncbi:MAG: OsmC family protein [Gammaproteobacteria bacterium]|nr:OsmC family protein [Gammaproteobacteria bacterium]